MTSKVSVIIPIYNVEKYLAKCLDSVLNQTYKNLEILCIDDCSPDNSALILEKYSKQDNRIKIIKREKNGGLSAARNTGIDASTGEYLYFLDSDDWIELDYIEKMVEKIKETDVDIVLNTNILKTDGEKSEPFIWYKYKNPNPQGEYLEKMRAIQESQCMIWCHLYKKLFIDKYALKFPEGYIHEDEYFQHISKINTDKRLS